MVNIAFFVIFAVFDPSPLTVGINCSFLHLLLLLRSDVQYQALRCHSLCFRSIAASYFEEDSDEGFAEAFLSHLLSADLHINVVIVATKNI